MMPMKKKQGNRELYFAFFLIVFCLLAAAGCEWMRLRDMSLVFLALGVVQALIVLVKVWNRTRNRKAGGPALSEHRSQRL